MTILVTGVGAIIGYGIIQSLRQQKMHSVRIVGMDIYDDAYGRFLCDSFYVAERADSPRYEAFVRDLVTREGIELIIPGIEQDMYRLFELGARIPARVVLNNELLTRLSKDKLETYEFFREQGLNVIPTLSKADYEACVEKLGSPFLLKPRTSYASKGIHRIRSKEEFVFYNKEAEANLCQKIIGSDAEEYTVVVFGKADGTYADHIILQRKLAQTGATDKASLVAEDAAIMDYVDDICRLTKPVGPTNIQLRKEDGKVYLLEINPRISSACSIRTAMGYNDPLKCIEYYLYGRHMAPQEKKPLHAVRFISDYFYE